MLFRILLVLAAWLPGTAAHSFYRDRIPNGRHVPNPCDPSGLWQGVGHQNSAGGGPRNPFGLDFAKNGHRWTRALCEADSEGDGMTNGAELGDPQCQWSMGQSAPTTPVITHPGVCDPYDSPVCQERNSWLDCSSDKQFECEHIKQPGVLNMTLRFPRTKVPAKETTYICFNFKLPNNERYHLIALEPVIDNDNVMHHMLLFACDDSAPMMTNVEECRMMVEGCEHLFSAWTRGMPGLCYPPEAGFAIGSGSIRKVLLQLHWTNAEKTDGWYDSSGVRVHYTPRLRQYNAGSFLVGQTYMNIPPGQQSWPDHASCTPQCTSRLMTGDIELFGVMNHMHRLGIQQNLTLIRPGQSPQLIADDDHFRYDRPVLHEYDTPINIGPGDELKTLNFPVPVTEHYNHFRHGHLPGDVLLRPVHLPGREPAHVPLLPTRRLGSVQST